MPKAPINSSLLWLIPIIAVAVLFAAWTSPQETKTSDAEWQQKVSDRLSSLEDRVLDLEHPAYTRDRR